MLDIKEWLEENTKLKAIETCFKNPPKLPYIIFITDDDIGGGDCRNCIISRDVTIELYSDIINKEKEKAIEDMLNKKQINYSKSRVWLDSERMFQTSYDFNLYEKMEG